MKREHKLDIIKVSLQEVKGIFKAVITAITADLKIGQLVLLDRVLQDKTAVKDLQDVFTKVSANIEKDQAYSDLEKQIKGSGFRSVNSLINFAFQLKADQALNLQAVLEEDQAVKDLQKTVKTLLDSYEYTS